jgi:replicative DNA helicase
MSVELMSPDRLPPQSRDAEKCVLGSILRDNTSLNEIQPILSVDNFYFDAHQKIFQAISDLYNDGKPIDLIILHETLKQRKHLEDVGGAPYLGELWDSVPTAANAAYYARIVREKALIRNLIHTSTELLRDAYDGSTPAEELLGMAERKILEIAEKGVSSETYDLNRTLQEAFTRIDERAGKHNLDVSGIATGFVDLDMLTAGFQNNELIIIAARPSVGKTAFALNVIRHAIIEDRHPAFFVSLEMGRVELAERLLSCQAKVDSFKIRKGTLSADDISRLMVAGDQLRGNARDGFVKLFIDDTPAQNMLRISANARRLKLKHGLKLVVIDYLQLIEPENRRDPRQEQVAQVSRRLKFLAKELQIPVIALAQVNRSSENREDHRPRLSDLRESGSIEQDADTVIMLHRPGRIDKNIEDNILEVSVEKQRNGPTGTITLTYLRQYMRYENYAPEIGESPYGI